MVIRLVARYGRAFLTLDGGHQHVFSSPGMGSSLYFICPLLHADTVPEFGAGQAQPDTNARVLNVVTQVLPLALCLTL